MVAFHHQTHAHTLVLQPAEGNEADAPPVSCKQAPRSPAPVQKKEYNARLTYSEMPVTRLLS